MNNNIKDTTSLVFVKGKNLIDSSKIMFGSVASGTGVYGYYSYSAVTDYIPVETGVYYLKLFNPGSSNNAVSVFRIVGYDSNKNYLLDDTNLDITERMITVTSTKYIRICFKKDNYQTISSLQDIISSNPQLEAGSQATTFQEYEDRKILVKNKNGVYEKFLDVDEIEDSIFDTGWVDITLQNGVTARENTMSYKPQIRRIGNIIYLKGQINIPANISVLATIPEKFRPSYEVKFPSVTPNCWLGPAGEIRMSQSSSTYSSQAINTSWTIN